MDQTSAPTSFTLAPPHPLHLFGRDAELAALKSAVERLLAGESALLLLSGPSGSGKSSLVNAGLQPFRSHRQLHIATAAFEQGQPAAPYQPLRRAFSAVVRQILAAGDAIQARWRQRLCASLGRNGQVMVDFIPELAWLLGQQPPLIELEPEAHRHRFHVTLRRFIAALAPASHPLVFVWDNLYWADEESLALFLALAGDSQPAALLLVGVVSDESQRRAAPAAATPQAANGIAAALAEAGADFAHLALAPLPLAAINDLLADLLHAAPAQTLLLAERIHVLAQGNPFFTVELIQSLARAGAITPDPLAGGYRWDLAAVDRLPLGDDVAELLAQAIDDLPDFAQRLLRVAALLGMHFDLATLAQALELAPQDAAAHLQPALDAGLLTQPDAPQRGSDSALAAYQFRHERIRKAAQAGLGEQKRLELHARIGRSLLALGTAESPVAGEPVGRQQGERRAVGPDPAGDRLFVAVHHLNAAASLLTTPDERRQLAGLNRTAGKRARSTASYGAAWGYLRQGLALLADDPAWAGDDLALALHVEAAEIAYLTGQHQAAEALAGQVAAQTHDPVARTHAAQIRVQAAIARNDLDQAMTVAAAALRPLGIDLPRRAGAPSLLASLARTRHALRGRCVEDLAALPPVTDASLQAAGRLMASLGEALQWEGNPNRLALLTLEGMRLSLRHGLFPTSAVGYAGYGALLCLLDAMLPGMGDIDTARRLGQLAEQLAERPETQPYRARIAVPVHYIITHRHDHQRASLAPLLAGYQAGLDSGDPEAATLCALCYVSHAFQLGLPLAELDRQIGEFSAASAQFGQRGGELALAINHQAVLNLLGRAADPLRLNGERCDEETVQAELAHSRNRSTQTALLIVKAHLAYLFHDRDAALALVEQVRPHLREIAGFFAYPRFLALDALIRLAACDGAGRSQRRRLLRQARGDLRRLQPWARQTPMNHLHEVHLIQAELARVQGRTQEAAAHYETAIRLCQEHGWAADEPLAAERAARCLLAAGQIAEAQAYLCLARAGYLRWGALAVVQHMEQVYGMWLPHERAGATEVATTSRRAEATEVATTEQAMLPEIGVAVRAAQAAAGEEDLAAGVQRLMAVVVAQAGAQRGVLLVPDPAEDPAGETVASLRVEAESLAGGATNALHGQRLVDQPLEATAAPRRVVNFVVHSRQSLALADASQETPFDADPAVIARQIHTLLCLPLRQAGRLLGVLYLEELPEPEGVAPERVDALALLATQAALSVQNARLREGSRQGDKETGRQGDKEGGRQVDKEVGRQGNKETMEKGKEEAGEAARWVGARMRQAGLHGRAGRRAEANAQVDEALALAAKSGDDAAWRPLALGFTLELAVLPGGLQHCQTIAQQSGKLAPTRDDELRLARLAQQAMVAWLHGRLDEVLAAQRQALALAPLETASWPTPLNDLMGLAISAHTARREYEQAQQALDMQTARLRHAGSGPLRAARLLFRQARLDWLRGQGAASSGLAQARELLAAQSEHPWAAVLTPTLAGLSALVESRYDLAEQHLRQAAAAEAATPGARLLVQPSLLLAHALHAQGAVEPALEALIPVLETCRREHTPGFVVQEGAAVIPLLRLAAQQGRCGPMAAHVLSLLGVSNVTRRLLVPKTGIVLNPREVDVLELLAANASNRAIAERLDVDIATVKSHVTRVLAKLGVRTHHEAAEQARALGLGNGW